jgi:peroxiredoxin
MRGIARTTIRTASAMTLRIGDRTGDVTFLQADGGSLQLSAFAGKTLLLIFLRHLA